MSKSGEWALVIFWTSEGSCSQHFQRAWFLCQLRGGVSSERKPALPIHSSTGFPAPATSRKEAPRDPKLSGPSCPCRPQKWSLQEGPQGHPALPHPVLPQRTRRAGTGDLEVTSTARNHLMSSYTMGEGGRGDMCLHTSYVHMCRTCTHPCAHHRTCAHHLTCACPSHVHTPQMCAHHTCMYALTCAHSRVYMPSHVCTLTWARPLTCAYMVSHVRAPHVYTHRHMHTHPHMCTPPFVHILSRSHTRLSNPRVVCSPGWLRMRPDTKS